MVSSLDSIPSEYQWPLSWHFFSHSWWSKTNHLVVYIRFHYKKKKGGGKEKQENILLCDTLHPTWTTHCHRGPTVYAANYFWCVKKLLLMHSILSFTSSFPVPSGLSRSSTEIGSTSFFSSATCDFLVEDENRTLPLHFCFTRHLPFLLDFLDQSSSEPASS